MEIMMILSIFFIAYVPTLAFYALTPYITRKTESFGISIPEEAYNSPEVKFIRDDYRNCVLAFGSVFAVAVLTLSLTFSSDMIVPLFLAGGVFIQLGATFVFYLLGHRKMKNLKEKLQWAAGKSEVVVVDTSFRNKKMLISPLWFMLYALVILGTTAFGLYFYNSLPQQLPLHWNIRGEIDRWADKSMKLLFIAPILQIFIMLLMMFIYWMIGKAKQSIDPANPERSVEQNRIFRFRWSAYIVFMGMGLMLVFAVMQAGIMGFIKDSSLIIFPILGFAALSIGGSILLSIKTGQGGSRIPTGRDDNKQVVNREDDKYWRLGMFYYNPDDPAVFVEKRFGIGWTNNFARPTSWVMLGGLLVFIFALPVIMIFLSK